jgi:hypothetical protein
LYRAGDRSGVLPVNFNFGADNLVHKGQFLCLGENMEACHRILRAAESDLPVAWDYERD